MDPHPVPGGAVRAAVVAIVTALVLSAGCLTSGDEVVRTGDLRTETSFLELGDANNVEVNLAMGNGGLVVRTDSPRLMDATFKYNVDQWKPRVGYHQEGEVWNLTVTQPNTGIKVEGDATNSWDLHFGTYVPMAMNIEIGAGDGNIQIYDMNLVSLSVATGAGSLDVDLSGPWSAHLVARLGTGAGNVKMVVPSDVGVQITVEQGTGSVVAPGFTKQGDNYVNEAYGTATVLMLVAVRVGAGDIVVLEVP